MATGIVLMVIGVFVLLRTVVPGQERSLVDLIAPPKSDDGDGGDEDKGDEKVAMIEPNTLSDAVQQLGAAVDRAMPPAPYRGGPRGTGRPGPAPYSGGPRGTGQL